VKNFTWRRAGAIDPARLGGQRHARPEQCSRSTSARPTFNTAAELSRRTPATTLLFNYLGNFSEANGEQSANNERINGSYDLRLNNDWFVRPALFEV